MYLLYSQRLGAPCVSCGTIVGLILEKFAVNDKQRIDLIPNKFYTVKLLCTPGTHPATPTGRFCGVFLFRHKVLEIVIRGGPPRSVPFHTYCNFTRHGRTTARSPEQDDFMWHIMNDFMWHMARCVFKISVLILLRRKLESNPFSLWLFQLQYMFPRITVDQAISLWLCLCDIFILI